MPRLLVTIKLVGLMALLLGTVKWRFCPVIQTGREFERPCENARKMVLQH